MSKRAITMLAAALTLVSIVLMPESALAFGKKKPKSKPTTTVTDPNDAYQGGYQVGVYYMPSWDMLDSKGVPISPEPDMKWHHLLYNDQHSGFTIKRKYTPQHPWEGPFLDREPKLGWYDDADPKVWSQQLDWMADHGIDFIAFDWYWFNPTPAYSGWEMMHEPLHAYLKVNRARSEARKIKFLLNWCPDGGYYAGTLEGIIAREGVARAKAVFLADFDSRIQTRWIPYFKESFYVKQDGKPVIYFYQAEGFESRAKLVGVTNKDLLARARSQVIAAGFPGLVVIGGSDSIVKKNYTQTINQLRDQTFDGTTAYFYHEYLGPNGNDLNFFFHKYPSYDGTGDHMNSGTWFGPEEMVKAYGLIWNDIRAAIGNRQFQYTIPVTPGFDRRPMGGSFYLDQGVPDHSQFPNAYPHDQMGTPDDFKKMLLQARKFANANASILKSKTIIICSWNEYTEGSMIEPSKKWGTRYLEKIREVFKPVGWRPATAFLPVKPPVVVPDVPVVIPLAPPIKRPEVPSVIAPPDLVLPERPLRRPSTVGPAPKLGAGRALLMN